MNMNLHNWKNNAVLASQSLTLVSAEQIKTVLLSLATETDKNSATILQANAKDLAKLQKTNPLYDRLMLTKERLAAIADDIRNVANLPSPLGKILMEKTHYNGMTIRQITVPFGVVGVIYEARPNVSFDVFSLCLKSGNACVLKGGSDAYYSNCAIVELIREVLAQNDLDENIVTLLPAGREATSELLNAEGVVDVIIPRGGRGLIDFVRKNATIPVIETGAGVCHTYFDEFGDVAKGKSIVYNAKTRRVSVCNALDCLIIHKNRLSDLKEICLPLAAKQVIIYADLPAYDVLRRQYPEELLKQAEEKHFGVEFLDYKMSIKTVLDMQQAMTHIRQYSSKHSECIVTESHEHSTLFTKTIDAACVYSNVSTAFTDGAQFGLGAEIGISTQKLHARGPMGLEELCTYKWIIEGEGQVR